MGLVLPAGAVAGSTVAPAADGNTAARSFCNGGLLGWWMVEHGGGRHCGRAADQLLPPVEGDVDRLGRRRALPVQPARYQPGLLGPRDISPREPPRHTGGGHHRSRVATDELSHDDVTRVCRVKLETVRVGAGPGGGTTPASPAARRRSTSVTAVPAT